MEIRNILQLMFLFIPCRIFLGIKAVVPSQSFAVFTETGRRIFG